MSERQSVKRLPAPPTRFIGRAQELDALLAMLEGGARLVTLLGPPGIGKTRLAIEVGKRVAPAGSRDVWMFDLSEKRTLGAIWACLAQELGVALSLAKDDQHAIARVGEAISALGAPVIVLDSFEHVAERAAAAVDQWRTGAPGACFLITSRQRLALPGETLFDIAALSTSVPESDPPISDAMRLFIDRASMVHRGFAPGPRELRAIDAIVRQLDGIPLAIELAAARVRLVGVEELWERIQRAPEILRPADSSLHAPLRTMRAAIACSWELLRPWEQAVLAQCSTFRGGFDLAAAERIVDLARWEDAPSVVDVLEALCDRSLLRTEPVTVSGSIEPRFFTYASIREFAADELSTSGRADAAQQRHAAFYSEAAEEWALGSFAPGAIDADGRLRLEHDNVAAAHTWSMSTRPVTAERIELGVRALLALEAVLLPATSLTKYVGMLDEAIARSAETNADLRVRARAHIARSRVLGLHGRPAEAVQDGLEAVRLADRADDSRLLGRALHYVGDAYWWKGDLRDAREYYEKALPALSHEGDRRLAAIGLNHLAGLDLREGRIAQARLKAERALATMEELEDVSGLCVLLMGELPLVARSELRYHAARSYLERALAYGRARGAPRTVAVALWHLAEVDREQGCLEEARSKLDEARDALREVPFAAALVRGALAKCAEIRGDAAEAIAHLEEAIRLHRVHDSVRNAGLLRAHLAACLAGAGDLPGAEAALTTAEAELGPQPDCVSTMVLELCRGHLEATRANECADEARASAHRAAVKAHLDSVSAQAERGDNAASASLPTDPYGDVRHLMQTLSKRLAPRVVGRSRRIATDGTAPRAIAVSARNRVFSVGGGRRVSLANRPRLWSILEALVARHRTKPGGPLRPEALAVAAWPSSDPNTDAASSRVYVAISTLRKLGLQGLLLRTQSGYLLDASTLVEDLDG